MRWALTTCHSLVGHMIALCYYIDRLITRTIDSHEGLVSISVLEFSDCISRTV